MKSSHLAALLTCCSLILSLNSRAQQSGTLSANENASYAARVPGVVYVQFRPGYLPPLEHATEGGVARVDDPILKIFREIGVSKIDQFDPEAWKDPIDRKLGIDRIYTVYYTSNAQPLGVVVRLLQTGLVETASPRYIFKPQYMPNDPGIADEYYLDSIRVYAAWDMTKGDSNVLIADVDEGVNVKHEDLKANIKAQWNAFSGTADATPPACQGCEAEHGTMTTGCFGAVADNHTGIAGVAPNCKIVAVRISDNNGQLTAAYEGLHWASNYCAQHAARAVINNSWGGRSDAEALPFASIFPQEITARGQVCVASAGNYHMDNDVTPFYPACVPGVLSVGATGKNGQPTSFTHYGRSVLVYAPGDNIYTTDLGSQNNEYTDPQNGVAGTSFSGPIVAGVVGLVMSQYPNLSPDAVKQRIIQSCDRIPNADTLLYHGRVNAANAIASPTNPLLAVQDYLVGTDTLGTLKDIGSSNSLIVDFVNLSTSGSNLTAQIIPGGGYTWLGYDARYPALWPNTVLGNIGNLETRSWNLDIIRTGEYSEGSIPVYFRVTGPNYLDTLHIQVPLTKQSGMTHRLLVQHATCVKQVDARTGWAGFGYYLNYHDPEKNTDSVILVSQYSVRNDTGWTIPADIDDGSNPATTVDAIDAQHAWFGGASTTQEPIVMFTADGGNSWNVSHPSTPIRSIHFTSANNGMIVGESNGRWQIYNSNDGGQSWTMGSASAANPNEYSFTNGAFWNGTYGWIGTNQGQVYYTANNGASWIPIRLQNGTNKQVNVMNVGFSTDNSTGYASVRAYGSSVDSAGLFFSQTHGAAWSLYTKAPAGFIPYGVSFLPGTTTAVITSNQGVFTLKSPQDSLQYLAAPASWNARGSVISAGGNSGSYTISAVSDASGIVDYNVGGSAVHSNSNRTASELSIANSPNPFSNSTLVYFTLSQDEQVRIRVTDVLGREVSDVYDGVLSIGPHAMQVELRDTPNGIYHCTIDTESGEHSEKSIVLMR